MATADSHSLAVPSTSFKVTAQLLRAAAAEMERERLSLPPELVMSPAQQMLAFCEYVLDGSEGDFDARELAYIDRVKVAAL